MNKILTIFLLVLASALLIGAIIFIAWGMISLSPTRSGPGSDGIR